MATALDCLPGELAFTTSGTTGPPVRWWRTRDQLLAEARILADLVTTDDAPVDAVVTHAPPRHLYGYLFGELVPALLDAPVRRATVTEPPPAVPGGLLVVAVPSTWWWLARSAARLRHRGRVTVVHSTATLPAGAAAVLAELPNVSLCELHGSTETGLVGTRTAPGADWTLAPDVCFAPSMSTVDDDCRPLSIRSPRLARRDGHDTPATHTMDDIVRLTAARHYRLTGARGRLVNIDGRRVDIAALQGALRRRTGLDASCRMVTDPLRGEWYEVLVPGGDPERQRIRAALDRLLPAGQMPRAVHATGDHAAGDRWRGADLWRGADRWTRPPVGAE